MPWHIPEENHSSKIYMYSKSPKCPSTEEQIKTWCVYTHTHTHIYTHTHTVEYHSAIKNYEIISFAAT